MGGHGSSRHEQEETQEEREIVMGEWFATLRKTALAAFEQATHVRKPPQFLPSVRFWD